MQPLPMLPQLVQVEPQSELVRVTRLELPVLVAPTVLDWSCCVRDCNCVARDCSVPLSAHWVSVLDCKRLVRCCGTAVPPSL